jgi:hypothetical protein
MLMEKLVGERGLQFFGISFSFNEDMRKIRGLEGNGLL